MLLVHIWVQTARYKEIQVWEEDQVFLIISCFVMQSEQRVFCGCRVCFSFRNTAITVWRTTSCQLGPIKATAELLCLSDQHTAVIRWGVNPWIWMNQVSQWFSDSFDSHSLRFWMNQLFEWIVWMNDSMAHLRLWHLLEI